MRYGWDPAKSAACYADRGLDFAYARRVFDGDVCEFEDERFRYGERRFKVIGSIEGAVYAVIYTMREPDLCWIVSARLAEAREVREWQDSIMPPRRPGRPDGSTSKRSGRRRSTTSRRR